MALLRTHRARGYFVRIILSRCACWCACSGCPGSGQPSESWAPPSGLANPARTTRCVGASGGIWGYLKDDPEASRIFGEAMTAKAQGHIAAIVQSYDFSRFKVIADIGGGRGHLIEAVIAAAPAASGVLFDQPPVIDEGTAVKSDRLKVVGGDFFADPLPKADAYILMEVIHDWDDDASRKILRGIRRVAPVDATLLLVEALLRNESSPNWPTTLDIVMLTIGGRQRTLEEYAALLGESGFALTREIDTHAGIAVIEATAI